MSSSLFQDVESGKGTGNENTPLLSSEVGVVDTESTNVNGQHSVIEAVPLHRWQEILLKALAATSVALYIASIICSNNGERDPMMQFCERVYAIFYVPRKFS